MKPDAADRSDYNLNAHTCIWFNVEEIRYVSFFIVIIYIINHTISFKKTCNFPDKYSIWCILCTEIYVNKRPYK